MSRSGIHRSALALFAVSILLAASQAPDLDWLAAGDAKAAGIPPAADYLTRTEDVVLDRVVVQFAPETGCRIRDGQLVSTHGADLTGLRSAIGSFDGARLERRFPRSEAELDRDRSIGEQRSRQSLPDLNLFGLLLLPSLSDQAAAQARLADVLARLNTTPGIVAAWAVPKPVPALFREVRFTPSPLRSDTPDFSPLQGYLYDSPVGIWADSAWTFPGGKGEGVKMIDIEWGWLWTHEDLKEPWYTSGATDPSDHGTAVAGEYGGQHNGYGINGIAPEMEIGGIYVSDLAAVIAECNGVLAPGDIYLIEMQVSGPEDWMPMEWHADVFAAIQTSTALGIICVEAGGNGSIDLDDPLYNNWFDRRVHDSGAIMVGAGTPQGLDGEWFTNHGTRLSLQGWGSSVVTTCCGDLQGGDPEVRYTAGFNGTSSASPIVTGAVASLQGQARALFGTPMTPALVEEILSVTGSPYNGTKMIGERPNLAAARERLLQGYGDVVVTVRDGSSLEPMPGMIVEIAETGRFHMTGPEGQVAMQLSAGDLTFRVSGDFFYDTAEFPYVIEAGGQHEVTLDVFLIPQGSLSGVVTDARGLGLENVRVELSGTPLDAAWTGSNGAYDLAGVPRAQDYLAIASRVPTKGAAAARLEVTAGQATDWSPVLPDAESFEDSNGGYTATNEWEWGTPTWPPNQNKPIPFSGTKVWGTDLDGAYDDLTTSILTSPTYDMTQASRIELSFHHWMWIDTDDGGQVQVWNNQLNRWDLVTPVEGYPDDNIIILSYQPGFNGRQQTWEPVVCDLSAYAGPNFKFRLYFRSNFSGVGVGWYIDDVALDSGHGPTAVEFVSGRESGPRLLHVGPNPSSSITSIAFTLGSPAVADLELYNLSGALVRRIHGGPLAGGTHTLRWDGRDEAGRPVESGLYFYKLRAGDGVIDGRILRIR